ncbi:hypothetical protein FA95DRAFT_1604268 [Auriscalpium vulgare]|uniref:Uncharacterized protein n=1 Tax=Auriscalpium vulgare TaxID=40419 RepID=A0ACB8S1D7_9AGAM|nr:hypothetical protein FA95DRAFT_1604268 [Auriscalpium vulgare]
MADGHDLLSVLNVHGQAFLDSFALPSSSGTKRKSHYASEPSQSVKVPKLDDSDSEEWMGFGDDVVQDDGNVDGSDSDGDFDGGEDLLQDDGFTASSSKHAPDVVVFADASKVASRSSETRPTKAQVKAFMSSKVSTLRSHIDAEKDDGQDEGENGDER